MISAIRTTARAITTTMNFCLSPTCLHAAPAKGCVCCSRGHKSKSKAPARRRTRR